jgi:hypothetical protein
MNTSLTHNNTLISMHCIHKNIVIDNSDTIDVYDKKM